MARVPIPDDVAAKILFFSDRICCVCRVPKKPLQIHHIDEDSSNSVIENLAVLCLDCHTETQIKGGFGRKLDAAQVMLYRDEWLDKVGRYTAEIKTTHIAATSPNATFSVDADAKNTYQKHRRVASRLKQLEGISRSVDQIIRHNRAGEIELRDKNIDKLLLDREVQAGTEIFLRAMQGKIHLVDLDKVQKQIDEWKNNESWSSLARAYRQLGRRDEAIEYYCLHCIKGLKSGNPFNAGFYLKEMIEHDLLTYLFERALQEAKQKDDVWWQIRSLQELGRDDEVDNLVIRYRDLIERQGRPLEKNYLRAALRRNKAEAKKVIKSS